MSGGGTPGGLPLIFRFWLNCVEFSPVMKRGTLILVNQFGIKFWVVPKKLNWPMRYLFRRVCKQAPPFEILGEIIPHPLKFTRAHC